jgi:hypothetical protein
LSRASSAPYSADVTHARKSLSSTMSSGWSQPHVEDLGAVTYGPHAHAHGLDAVTLEVALS